MEAEGIQKFFGDLGVDPMDVITLHISKYMKAETMGVYSFAEFECGFKTLGCQTISDLKAKLSQLSNELKDPNSFKELYKFTFEFTRDQGYKNIAIETAIGLWELLLNNKCIYRDMYANIIIFLL